MVQDPASPWEKGVPRGNEATRVGVQGAWDEVLVPASCSGPGSEALAMVVSTALWWLAPCPWQHPCPGSTHVLVCMEAAVRATLPAGPPCSPGHCDSRSPGRTGELRPLCPAGKGQAQKCQGNPRPGPGLALFSGRQLDTGQRSHMGSAADVNYFLFPVQGPHKQPGWTLDSPVLGDLKTAPS